MVWQFQLFMILMPFAAAIILVCVFTSWKWRFSPKGKFFILSQLCALGFLIFNTLELITISPELTILFMKTSFIFLVLLPPVWLVFSLHYIGHPLRKIGWVLFILPIATLVLIWMNESLHWFWTDYQFIPIKGMLAIRTEYGFWFMVNVLYSHTISISGTIILLFHFTNFPKVFRHQTRLIIFGVSFPVLYNLISILRILPIQKDFSPIALAIPAIAFTVSIFRYQLMDLSPVSRASVVEYLQDGIIIVDKKCRILDINHVARELIQIEDVEPIGLGLHAYFPDWDEIQVDESPPPERDIFFCINGKEHKFKLLVSSFNEDKILVFRDVTETEKIIEDMQSLAASDSLTGLFNRQHLYEMGEKAFGLAVRYRRPLSILLIDVDRFKKINNRYGHSMGDEVLCTISKHLQQNLRKADILARYGGDEFIILLPETELEYALVLSERLRKEINEISFAGKDSSFNITLTIGISSLSDPEPVVSFEGLFDKADKALYQAKRRGRNQSLLWK
jgi:diguanylate cyclase (GGDEF)-like protein